MLRGRGAGIAGWTPGLAFPNASTTGCAPVGSLVEVGTGFVTMLHLSRNAFFFLSGLVICYSQISHPRGLRAFWSSRHRYDGCRPTQDPSRTR